MARLNLCTLYFILLSVFVLHPWYIHFLWGGQSFILSHRNLWFETGGGSNSTRSSKVAPMEEQRIFSWLGKNVFQLFPRGSLSLFFFELARVETSQHSATPGEEGHSGVKKTCGVEAHSDLGHLTALVFGRWVPVLRPSYEEHSGNTTGQLSTEISLSGRFLLPPAVYRLVAACPTSSSTPKPPDLSHFSVTQSWIYLYCAGGRES